MIETEVFEQFTIYKEDISNTFIYANFEDPDLFMDGLAEFLLSENNLLNYANALTPIPFTDSPVIYKRLYNTLSVFLNSELEQLVFDNIDDKVRTILGEEYRFTDDAGKTVVPKDKIGKIGEYALHLILTNYFKVNCILPKFRCVTDRNMSVFGIDALFLNTAENTIYFGESKVCNTIDNAITLVNRSFDDYEQQIEEEYKMVFSDNVAFNLSQEFRSAFQQYIDVCFTFQDFIKKASINKICIPAFLAHGNSENATMPKQFLDKMNSKIQRKQFFGLDTKYLFISLPIIDKSKMMEIIMKKVVEKSNEYQYR